MYLHRCKDGLDEHEVFVGTCGAWREEEKTKKWQTLRALLRPMSWSGDIFPILELGSKCNSMLSFTSRLFYFQWRVRQPWLEKKKIPLFASNLTHASSSWAIRTPEVEAKDTSFLNPSGYFSYHQLWHCLFCPLKAFIRFVNIRTKGVFPK